MAIKLETSQGRGIDNFQDTDIPLAGMRWCNTLSKLHPLAQRRTAPTPKFNCHGLTFASRRTKILDRKNIERILADDAYEMVSIDDLLPGDVVVYYGEDGDPNHSGIVVEIIKDIRIPRVCSKWGYAGEFLHALDDVPDLYGPVKKFFRCNL